MFKESKTSKETEFNKSIEKDVFENNHNKNIENLELQYSKPRLKNKFSNFNNKFKKLKVKYNKDPKKVSCDFFAIFGLLCFAAGSSYREVAISQVPVVSSPVFPKIRIASGDEHIYTLKIWYKKYSNKYNETGSIFKGSLEIMQVSDSKEKRN